MYSLPALLLFYAKGIGWIADFCSFTNYSDNKAACRTARFILRVMALLQKHTRHECRGTKAPYQVLSDLIVNIQ